MSGFQEIISDLIDLSQVALSDRDLVRNAGIKMESLLLGEKVSDADLELDLGSLPLHRLQGLYEKYETSLEYDFAKRVIAGYATEIQYPLYQRFRRLITAELHLGEIASSGKVLFIGSGPFPISPILFSQLTDCAVDCYDRSSEACATSTEVTNKLGLSKKVRILNSSGENGEICGYGVIVIALLAQPKHLIIDNIFNNASEDTRVVCRTSEGTRRVFYQETAIESYNRYFNLISRHRAGVDDTISSLLLGRNR